MVQIFKKIFSIFIILCICISFYNFHIFMVETSKKLLFKNEVYKNVHYQITTREKHVTYTINEFDVQQYDKLNEQLEETHHLENLCKYPVLHPYDNDLNRFLLTELEYIACKKVLPNIVSFENGVLSINQTEVKSELNCKIICKYRPIGGTLMNNIKLPVPLGPWVTVKDKSAQIYHDQIEVHCFKEESSESFYNFSFAHIPRKPKKTFTQSSKNRLSLSIIMLDSVSRNAFRRHMPVSWEYLVNDMEAMDLEGLMKVGDNTAVNLIPLLTGLRYHNMSRDMPSDLPLGKPIDMDSFPLLWKEFRDKKCVTMLNDDPVHLGFGLFQNPHPEFRGFKTKPTDYWFRPWHIYHRLHPVKNASKLCFGNEFTFDWQLKLHEQMSTRYFNRCYFALSFFGEISHDDSTYLELMDNSLKMFLQRLKNLNVLNNTVFVVMGDHGQRIHIIRHSFIGRVEERTPLFAIVFPKWFREKYPDIIRNLKLNRNRLTSHYDIHQVFKDIADNNFDGKQIHDEKYSRSKKGISLLRQVVPANRTCKDAHVPENHCVCLVPDKKKDNDYDIKRLAYEVILNYSKEQLQKFPECKMINDIKIVNISKWTLNQMVQHGVRVINKQNLKVMQRKIRAAVEYFEVQYVMHPINVSALIRLQHNKHEQSLFVNVEPMVLSGRLGCKGKQYLPKFCKCIKNNAT